MNDCMNGGSIAIWFGADGWGAICEQRRAAIGAGSASDSAGSGRRGLPRLPFSPPATPRGTYVRLRQGVNPLVTGALTSRANAAERRTYDMILSWHGMVGEKEGRDVLSNFAYLISIRWACVPS